MISMALPNTFDELNQLTGYKRSISISKYFDEMKLTQQQKTYRKAFARRLEEEMIWLMSYLFYARQQGIGVSADAITEIRQRYANVLAEIQRQYPQVFADIQRQIYTIESLAYVTSQTRNAPITPTNAVVDAYIASHINSTSADIVNATNRHPDDPYFYSKDRARVIAENESSTIFDHAEYQTALKGKTRKRWLTIMDNHERESHAEANGMVVPVNEPFELAGGALMHPHDSSLGCSEDELINCRCSVEYF